MDYCLAQLYYLFVCNILNPNGSLWISFRKLSHHMIWNWNFLKLEMIETRQGDYKAAYQQTIVVLKPDSYTGERFISTKIQRVAALHIPLNIEFYFNLTRVGERREPRNTIYRQYMNIFIQKWNLS